MFIHISFVDDKYISYVKVFFIYPPLSEQCGFLWFQESPFFLVITACRWLWVRSFHVIKQRRESLSTLRTCLIFNFPTTNLIRTDRNRDRDFKIWGQRLPTEYMEQHYCIEHRENVFLFLFPNAELRKNINILWNLCWPLPVRYLQLLKRCSCDEYD
jgi:hypothetical protein